MDSVPSSKTYAALQSPSHGGCPDALRLWSGYAPTETFRAVPHGGGCSDWVFGTAMLRMLACLRACVHVSVCKIQEYVG